MSGGGMHLMNRRVVARHNEECTICRMSAGFGIEHDCSDTCCTQTYQILLESNRHE